MTTGYRQLILKAKYNIEHTDLKSFFFQKFSPQIDIIFLLQKYNKLLRFIKFLWVDFIVDSFRADECSIGISKHANQWNVLEKRLNHVDEDSNRDSGKKENTYISNTSNKKLYLMN